MTIRRARIVDLHSARTPSGFLDVSKAASTPKETKE